MIDITSDGQIIAMISMSLAVMSALVRNAVLDKEKLKEHKEKLKEYQKELKEATKAGDAKRAKKVQEKLMKSTMENLKQSFKPMMFTSIPFIIIFYWLRKMYADVGSVVTLFGHGFGWLGWYIICSFAVSIILNKVLKLT